MVHKTIALLNAPRSALAREFHIHHALICTALVSRTPFQWKRVLVHALRIFVHSGLGIPHLLILRLACGLGGLLCFLSLFPCIFSRFARFLFGLSLSLLLSSLLLLFGLELIEVALDDWAGNGADLFDLADVYSLCCVLALII
jgi:hypothetical protein